MDRRYDGGWIVYCALTEDVAEPGGAVVVAGDGDGVVGPGERCGQLRSSAEGRRGLS